MIDNEKLDLILSEMQGMKSEIQGVRSEIRGMKDEIQEVKRRITSLELHIENFTDKNIQLIAENFIELTNKLRCRVYRMVRDSALFCKKSRGDMYETNRNFWR